MTVREFVKLNASGAMFRVINANKVGYMTSKEYVIEADRNVVPIEFGSYELVGYDAIGKDKIAIYIKLA